MVEEQTKELVEAGEDFEKKKAPLDRRRTRRERGSKDWGGRLSSSIRENIPQEPGQSDPKKSENRERMAERRGLSGFR